MSFGQAIKLGYQNYFKFSGKATRPEYWWFWLWSMILLAAFLLVLSASVALERQNTPLSALILMVSLLFALPLLGSLIPLFAVLVRRLHDSGHSGWWAGGSLLLSFINGFVRGFAESFPVLEIAILYWVLVAISIGINITIFVFLVQRSR